MDTSLHDFKQENSSPLTPDQIISGLRALFDLPKDLPIISVLAHVSNQIEILRPARSAFQFYKSSKNFVDFKAIFDASPVPMCVCSLAGNFLACNDQWSNLTGLPKEYIGKFTIVSICHPQNMVQLYSVLTTFAEGKVNSWSGMQHCVHSLGYQFTANLELNTVEMPEGSYVFPPIEDAYNASEKEAAQVMSQFSAESSAISGEVSGSSEESSKCTKMVILCSVFAVNPVA